VGKRVLLIKPPAMTQEGHSDPPLGLLYLAGTLRAQGLEVKVLDGYVCGRRGIEEAICSYAPDLLGITTLTASRHQSLEIARWAKERNPSLLTVLGGPHATIMWKQLLDNYPWVDVCVLGEGEMTLLEIATGKPWEEIAGIALRQNGNCLRTRPRKNVANLDELAFPAWEEVEFSAYPPRPPGGLVTHRGIDLARGPRLPVIFSRGCIGHCHFCSTWWIWKGWRHRSPANMVEELESLVSRYGIRHFCFEDDIFSADMEAAKSLCEEIISQGLKIAWFACTRADCVDEELLFKMAAAGCYGVSYGVESASQEILKHLGKQQSMVQAEQAIRLTKRAGMQATCLLIIGSPWETRESISETADFLCRAEPEGVGSVGGLWVFPGTKHYRELKQAGRVEDSFWLGPEPYLRYPSEHSPQELRDFGDAIWRRRKLTHYWLLRSRLARRAKRLWRRPARAD